MGFGRLGGRVVFSMGEEGLLIPRYGYGRWPLCPIHRETYELQS